MTEVKCPKWLSYSIPKLYCLLFRHEWLREYDTYFMCIRCLKIFKKE